MDWDVVRTNRDNDEQILKLIYIFFKHNVFFIKLIQIALDIFGKIIYLVC